MTEKAINIVVTGATKGIGRAVSEAFAAAAPAHLFVCARTQADLLSMKKALEEQFPLVTVRPCVADLSSREQVRHFADYIVSHTSTIDVLVNNTGVFRPGHVTEEPETVLEDLMKTNVYSAYYLTKYLLPLMLKNGEGHIFNLCSVASLYAYPDGGSYSITKFALLGFSKVLREELKDKNIKVTSVMPGITWSDAWSGATLPEQRLLQASDVADVIVNAFQLSATAVVEEILIRPMLGDLE